MPKAMPSMPRAPAPAMGRYFSSGSDGRPRSVRILSAAAPRSGALSIRVPSRSKRTAFTSCAIIVLAFPGHGQVVDARVATEPVAMRERVVFHALGLQQVQARLPAPRAQLAGLDELQVFMRATRQQVQHVLGPDDRKEEGLGVAVDRGEEDVAAGFHQRGRRL